MLMCLNGNILYDWIQKEVLLFYLNWNNYLREITEWFQYPT